MADRCLLHKNSLEDFKNWLIKDGWTIEPTKGEWEVLRARKSNHKNPLIIYDRLEAKEHYTVQSRDRGVVRAYLKKNLESESQESEN